MQISTKTCAVFSCLPVPAWSHGNLSKNVNLYVLFGFFILMGIVQCDCKVLLFKKMRLILTPCFTDVMSLKMKGKFPQLKDSNNQPRWEGL